MRTYPMPPAIKQQHKSARKLLQHAVRRGRVRIPRRCETCGVASRRHGGPRTGLTDLRAHHDDYAKPYEVRWLCHWCHVEADAAVRLRLRSLPDDFSYQVEGKAS